MILPKSLKALFRTVSALVAGIFLWNQVAWSGELLEKLNTIETSSSSMTASQLQSAQSAAQSVISINRDIESLVRVQAVEALRTSRGTVYDRKETRTDGWTYYYANNMLCEKARSTGEAYIYAYNGYGKLIKEERYRRGGSLYYTTRYLYGEDRTYLGKAISYVSGTSYEYDAQGRTTRYGLSSGAYYLYTYTREGRSNTTASYDSSGKPVYITTYFYNSWGSRTSYQTIYSNGSAYYYDAAGRVLKYVSSTGSYILYTYTATGKSSTVTSYDAAGRLIYATSYQYNSYGARTGYVTTYASGEKQYYNADGLMVKKVLSSGYYYTYEYIFRPSIGWMQVVSWMLKTVAYYTAQNAWISTTTYGYATDWAKTGKTVAYSTGVREEYDGTDRLTKRTEASGEYCLYKEYYASLRKKSVQYYDASGALKYSASYYDDYANRMESKTLAASDEAGMIYYHYMNESWSSQGYGRVDRARRAVTGPDGELSVSYTYLNTYSSLPVFAAAIGYFDPIRITPRAAPTILTKIAYSDADWKERICEYGYYNDKTNRVMSKSYAAPAADGVAYVSYINEDWNGRGYGRVSAEKYGDSTRCEYDYYDGTGSLRTRSKHGPDGLIWTETYFDGGPSRVEKRIWSSGVSEYYYDDAANRLEHKELGAADAYGNISYHYINEDWAGAGYGRIDRSTKPDGGYMTTSYYEASGNKKEEAVFTASGTRERLSEYYDSDAAVIHYQWLEAPIGAGVADSYREYDTAGRLVKSVSNDGSYSVYSEFYGDRNTAKYVRTYDPQGALRLTAVFGPSGALVSMAFSGGNTYYYESGVLARVETPDAIVIDRIDEDPASTYSDEAVYGEMLSVSVAGVSVGYIVVKDGEIWDTGLQSGYTASIVDGELFIRDQNGSLLGHDYGGSAATLGTFYQPDGYSNEEWYGLVEWGGPAEGEDPLPRKAYYSMREAYAAMAAPKGAYGSNVAGRPGRGTIVTDGTQKNSLGYWSGIGLGSSQVSGWSGTPGQQSVEIVNKRELKFTWNNASSAAKWFSTNVGPESDTNSFDASQYQYLMLRVKGQSGGEMFKVQLQDHDVYYQESTILNITRYASITKDYQDIYIPLQDFRSDPAHLNLSHLLAVSLLFRDATNGTQSIYVDQIKFVKSPASAPKGASSGPVKVAGRQVYVNGSAFEVKGVGYSRNDASTYDRDMGLIAAMGANTIRTWGMADRALLDSAASRGLRVAAGFWIDNSADIDPASATNSRESIKEIFRSYVRASKDSQGLLMWCLGNENNVGLSASKQANFYSLCNELAKIAYEEELSSYHPVAIMNSGYSNIGLLANGTTDEQLSYIDIWGDNRYPQQSFYYYEDYFNKYESRTDKPLFIAEYGTDAWHSNSAANPSSGYEDEATQATWDAALANEIYSSDVCVGGSVFMFSDDWSKTSAVSSKQSSSGLAYTRRTFSDGSIRLLDKTGAAVRVIAADGVTRYYDGSNVCVREAYGDGGYADFVYSGTAVTMKTVYGADGSYKEYDGAGSLLYSYKYAAPAGSGLAGSGLVSVKTSDGTTVYYDSYGSMKRVVKADGVELDNVVLDGAGMLKDAVIGLPDGTTVLVRNARAVQVRPPDGSILRVRDGTIQSEADPSGEVTIYNRQLDASGSLVRTVAARGSARAVYDASGNLKYSVNADGSGILYEGPVVRAVFGADGLTYIYQEREETVDGALYKAAGLSKVIAAARGEIAIDDAAVSRHAVREFRYDADMKLVAMVRLDGDVVTPGESAFAVRSGGADEEYRFRFDDFGCPSGMTVDRDGLMRTYDKEGRLSTLLKEDGTELAFTGDKLASVKLPDGAVLRNIRTGSGGSITGYDVVESDGSLTTYTNGVIDCKTKTDGTVIRYSAGRISRVEEPDGKAYAYSYPDGRTVKELTGYRLDDGTGIELCEGAIVKVVLPDGSVISEPEFSSKGALISADIDLGDGITGIISGGELSKAYLDGGSVELTYKDGRLSRAVMSGGETLEYGYTEDASGLITGTVVTGPDRRMRYDAAGLLTALEENGYTVAYEDGVVRRISLDELGISIDDPVFDNGYSLQDGVVTLTDGSVYTFSGGSPVSFLTPGNVLITYDRYGAISSIASSDDRRDYVYSRQSGGDISGVSVSYINGGTAVIDELIAYLKSAAKSSDELAVNRMPYNLFDSPAYTLSASADAGSISLVDRRADSAPADPLVKYEAAYNILSATTSMKMKGAIDFGPENYKDLVVGIGLRKDAATTQPLPIAVDFYRTTAQGEELVYTHTVGELSDSWAYRTIAIPASLDARPDRIAIRVLASNTTPHSGKFYVSEILPLQIKSLRPEDRTWTASLLPPCASIKSYLDAPTEDVYLPRAKASDFFGSLEISDYYGATPLRVEYDASGALASIKRTDGSVLDYSSNKPVTMKDPDGRLVEYAYSGPYVSGAKIFPEDDLTSPEIILEYEANRIKKATKGDVIYSYAYETGAAGDETVVITNGSTGYVYRYMGGELVSATAPEGLVTEYGYSAAGRIASARVSFRGKLVETFSYSYADDVTIVTDEKSIRRTYDKDDRLIYLETAEGLGYKYNYFKDDGGNDLLEVELYQSKGADGAIVYHKDGAVDRVELRDGTVIDLDDSGSADSLQAMTLKDGLVESVTYSTGETAYYERDDFGRIGSIRVEKDVTTRWYNPDGELCKMQSSPGEYSLYTYTRKSNGSIDKIKVSRVTVEPVGAAVPPVRLYAYSAGYNDAWDAGIFVDDKGVSSFNTNWWWSRRDESWAGRGYDVVVVDRLTGKVKSFDLFDTYGKGTAEADRMAAFINSVAEGDYVIAAIGDDGWTNMTEGAYRAIEGIGSSKIRTVGFRGSWAVIGQKGAASGTVPEGMNPKGAGPVMLSGYSIETSYYDTDGTPVPFSGYSPTLSTGWYSMRPTVLMDGMEPLSLNSDGDAVGYIKSYNPSYANSGLIRIWDADNIDLASEQRMSEIRDFMVRAGKGSAKAVYFDERYPVSWTTRTEARAMKEYFSSCGYEVVDANSIGMWLRLNGPGSALIMAQDVAPGTVVNKYTSDNAIRSYLDAGGTVVWAHDMPFYYIGNSDGSKYEVGENGQKKYLGVAASVDPRAGTRYTYGECMIPGYSVPAGAAALDTSVLYFDASVNYRDIDWHKVKASIGYELEDDTAVTSVYDKDGEVLSIAKADGTVSVYDENGKVDFICDIHDEIITDYEYDSGGSITKITMHKARQDIAAKIDECENYIAEKKLEQLEELAVQKGYILGTIRSQYASARSTLYSQRSAASAALSEWENVKCWFGWGKKEKNAACDYYRGVIGEIDRSLAALNNQESADLALLDTEIAGVKAEIESSAADALLAMEAQELKLLDELAVDEARPVIYEYYRTILGRDPGDSELLYWTAGIKASAGCPLDVAALRTYLYNSAEYIERTSRVGRIRGEIESELDAYLSKSADEKASYLASLGLTESECIALTETDVDTIVAWLAGQNIHFARSAVGIIGELLGDKGVSYNGDDLVRKAVLIDIFTGKITKFTTGELLISALSLKKLASLYGLDLTPSQITFDELKSMAASAKVPVFINGNHYAIVTAIDTAAGTVTLFEPSKGESGGSTTVDIEGFKSSWKEGCALTQESPARASSILTDYQAGRIRGACFGLEWIIAGLIGFAIGAIGAIANAIIAIVSTIVVSVVSAALQMVATFVGTIASAFGAIGHALVAGLHFVGTSIMSGFSSMFAWSMGSILPASATLPSFASGLVTFAAKTVVGVAVNFAVNFGLDMLGVDPGISRLANAFVTGGITGAIGGAGSFFNFASAAGAFAMEGVNQFGSALNLAPNITGVLSMAMGSITGGLLSPGTDVARLFKDVAINISSELACAGITTFGAMAGLDPRVSYLAGVGIRSTINAGLTHEFKPDVIWGSVTQGLLQGVTNIGLNYLTQEMGVNPLLANIGFSAISTALQAGIQSMMPEGEKDVFKAMFETYESNVLTFLGSGTSSDAWQQAAYISQILDFSNIVQERGLMDALNTYGAGLFNAIAVNAIVKAGYTLGGYFAEKLQTGQYRLETVNGQEVAVVDTPTQSDGGHSSGFFKWILEEGGVDGYWNPLGMSETMSSGDDFWGIGKLGTDAYGRLGFYDDSRIYQGFGDLGIWQTINDGYQSYAEITDNSGKTIFVVTPKEDGGYNYYNSYGDYVDAVLKEFDRGYTIDFAEGDISKLYLEAIVPVSEEARQLLATFGINDVDELGTLYYYLSDEDNRVSPISYYFNDEIRELINDNPYLIGQIIDFSTIAGDSKADLINAFFEGINYQNLTEGTVSRASKASIETIINQVESVYAHSLSDTTAILIPGTDFNQIWEDIKGDNSYAGRDPNWADGTSVKHYLADLGADVQSYNWSGNTTTDMNPTAEGLAAYVKNLHQQYPDRKITLIGHSAGDLIVEKALNILKADNIFVDTYIGLGSPSGNENRVHTNLGEWYNISSSKDIISLPSTSLKNTNQIRYNDLTHVDYFGVYKNGQVTDVGAFDRIMRILLRTEIEEILRAQ